MKKYKCTVLGATGLIGQQFLRMLVNHPFLELGDVYASSRSAGKSLRDIWQLPFFEYPEELSEIEIKDMSLIDVKNTDFDIAFSGLPANLSDQLELDLRSNKVNVFTNSSSHRMDDDVPILIPETNGEQIELAKIQKENYGAFIIANANCSVTGAAMYLREIQRLSNINSAIISTYQALSGAGINGVSSIRIADNVIPYIGNEESKIVIEAKKILGTVNDNIIIPAEFDIIANCARVAVIDGHTEAITTNVEEKIEHDELINSFKSIKSPLELSKYITAPKNHVKYLEQIDRPQPKFDRFSGSPIAARGMTTSVGRLRSFKHYISSFILVHNTIRGGAGGSILNAEYTINKKLI